MQVSQSIDSQRELIKVLDRIIKELEFQIPLAEGAGLESLIVRLKEAHAFAVAERARLLT